MTQKGVLTLHHITKKVKKIFGLPAALVDYELYLFEKVVV